MARPLVNPGVVSWTGQHWIAYLRMTGAGQDSGQLSVWHMHYCPAGEGVAVYANIPGDPGFRAVCTDNRGVAA